MKSSLLVKSKNFLGFTGLRAAGVLVIFVAVNFNLLAQTTIYIDPANSASGQNGSIQNPYSSWSQVSWSNGNTYLQKRGTSFITSGNIDVTGRSGITIGAYGSGPKPIIRSTASGVRVVRLNNSSNCIIRDLDISSSSTQTGLCAIGLDGTASNNLIDSCVLHSCEWGIRMVVAIGTSGNKVLNTEVHEIGDDGIYAKDVKSIEIGHCNIYDVNRKFLINPDQSYSAGDCIQLVGNPNTANALSINIHNNILDHSNMGNKFCLIVVGDYYYGTIERNIMTASNSTSCIYLWHTTGSVFVRKNTFNSGNYGIYSYVNDLQVHYNKFINNKMGINLLPSALTVTRLTALNNVFYNNTNFAIGISTANNPSVFVARNNSFYLTGTARAFYTSNSQVTSNNNNFNIERSSFINGYATLSAWQSASGNDLNSFVADPAFVNPVNGNFCLQPNSLCINSGQNVQLSTDFFETAVPQANNPDIGIHEVVSSAGNQSPLILNQTFSVPENSANGTQVGQVVASDPDAGQTISYSIIGGNTNNAFSINATTGVLSVANSGILNFESTPAFQLSIQVQDNGTGNLTSSATITVNLSNVNEVPSMGGQNFTIPENSPAGSVLGTMTASDPDQGQSISFSISSGNTGNAFSINPSTGAISVGNAQALNYEVQQNFQLVISAQDNGSPALSVTAVAAISVLNVNESPVINNQQFAIASYSQNGVIAGTVLASDPDQNQTLSYSITAGNTSSAFSINTSNGVISVANSAAVNYLINPTFGLTVRVQDNGSPALASLATITINVTPVNSAPEFSSQAFSVNENSPLGAIVGQLAASDPDPGQVLSFVITSGNTGNAFQLSSNGLLSVANPQMLNFESLSSFGLQVQVSDNGNPQLSATALISIGVNNLNETPAIAAGQSLSVAEHVANGTQVGSVTATDPDNGQSLNFSIISGNTNNAFSISSSTGMISVSGMVCFEACSNYSLVIRAADNGTPSFSDDETVLIQLTDVNENPVIADQSFSIDENSAPGSLLGTVIASDPDFNQTLSFSITAGNTNNAFAIAAESGIISVVNSSALNYLTNPEFNLTIRVQDNGTPVLASYATINVIVNDVNAAPVIADQFISIDENSPLGAEVGQVLASDPDAGQSLYYSLISGNNGNAFLLSTAGILTIANPQMLDFESNSSFDLQIQVTDNGNPQLSALATISIGVLDLNENPDISANQLLTVAEHVSAGTQVGIVLASDPDNGQSLTYSILSGNTNNAFSISASTGMISVSGMVCFEACSLYSLVIRAADNGTPSLYDDETINIQLSDVNENPVIIDQTFAIDENPGNGSIVGSVIASDPDMNQLLGFSITSGNTNNAFAIDASSGILSVSNSSTINYLTNPEFSLVVKVQDNGSPILASFATITIEVGAVNAAPVIASQVFSVNENSPVGTVVGQLVASDPDPEQVLSYLIASGNTGNAFQVSPNGLLSVANAQMLNYESLPAFELQVQVTDNGNPQLSATAIISIAVINLNEIPAIPSGQLLSVAEHVAAGTQVGIVAASDPDNLQSLAYSIVSGNTNNAFAVSSSTGMISVSGPICYEACGTYTLVVRATDNGTPSLSDDEAVTIQLSDVNENPLIANQSFTINDNSATGSIVGTVVASDPDFNQILSYSITSGNTNNAFAIDASSGIISVDNSNAVNYLTNPVFNLIIRVQDNGSPVLASSANITVTISGGQNAAPLISPQAFTLNENQPNGTIVGTITASDPNPGQLLTYSIISGNQNNAFGISSSGVLSVNNAEAIDFESMPSYSLSIRVADNGSPVLSAQAIVTIGILDINDAPMMLPQTYSVRENWPNNKYVCSINATDQDKDDTFQFSITGGNTLNAFKMQAYTGRIFVNNSIALDFETNPVFVLTVRCVDNHGAYSEQNITINILNVNEAPVVQSETFFISKTAANGTVAGQVNATDPDQGQSLRYSITQGNNSGIFAINVNSGVITVVNSAALLSSNSSSFALTIKVIDNGSPRLYTNGQITIKILQKKESSELAALPSEEEVSLKLKVYPNPSSDGFFNINLEEETNEETRLLITDLSGKTVLEDSFSGTLAYRINLSNLPRGIYLLRASNSASQEVKKLIVQ